MKSVKYVKPKILEMDAWLDIYADLLDIEAAETGMDRELSYDRGMFQDARYEKYLDNIEPRR